MVGSYFSAARDYRHRLSRKQQVDAVRLPFVQPVVNPVSGLLGEEHPIQH